MPFLEILLMTMLAFGIMWAALWFSKYKKGKRSCCAIKAGQFNTKSLDQSACDSCLEK